MIDPVSEELERRAMVSWPWRSALLAALVVHVATAGTVLLASRTHRRPLLLPSVQVRIGVVPPAPGGPAPPSVPARAAAPARQAPARPAAPPPVKASHQAPTTSRGAAAKAALAATAVPQTAAPGGDVEAASTGDSTAPVVSGTGGLAAQAGDSGGGESFPYDYYLQRLLGTIEANWFRPPAPDGTRCRVLCRIDRGGRLVESGIESPSAVPAFDRAALRAVYAAAPFPPLPQGFGGATLTLHLDFGP